MTIEYKKDPTSPVDTRFCSWAICFDIDGKNYDDRKPKTSIVATFRDPNSAEDFIRNCLPAETSNRFYIVRIS